MTRTNAVLLELGEIRALIPIDGLKRYNGYENTLFPDYCNYLLFNCYEVYVLFFYFKLGFCQYSAKLLEFDPRIPVLSA